MFPTESPFARVADASAKAAQEERERTRILHSLVSKDEVHAHRELKRIADELDDALALIETGDMGDFEQAVERLDNLSRRIREMLESGHGESSSG